MIIASFYAIVLFADIQVFQLPAKVYCYPQEFIKSLTSRPGAGQAQARRRPGAGQAIRQANSLSFPRPILLACLDSCVGGSIAKIFPELAQIKVKLK